MTTKDTHEPGHTPHTAPTPSNGVAKPRGPIGSLHDLWNRLWALEDEVNSLRGEVSSGLQQANEARQQSYTALKGEILSQLDTNKDELKKSIEKSQTENNKKSIDIQKQIRAIDERLDSRRLVGAFSLTILLYVANMIINLVRK